MPNALPDERRLDIVTRLPHSFERVYKSRASANCDEDCRSAVKKLDITLTFYIAPSPGINEHPIASYKLILRRIDAKFHCLPDF